MPTLAESLQGRDLGHLRIIAELWGIKLDAQEIKTAIRDLAKSLADQAAVNAMLSSLPAESRTALEDLALHAGRLPWAKFTRTYGEVREIGPAKRDRDRPFEHPVSVAETLWYRALVARAFFDTSAGPEEFAYLPEDFLAVIPESSSEGDRLIGRQASTSEYAAMVPANDHILDHACSMLANLRLGDAPPDSWATAAGEKLTSVFLKGLLFTAGIVDDSGVPMSEPLRKFLEAKRNEALFQLYKQWKESKHINELRTLPGLVFEGNWKNDPLRTRNFILELLGNMPAGKWMSLEAFIAAIKQRNPDFQRPAGDYDSWFIRELSSGEFIRGYEHWDRVDGRLIRYLLCGPLHWLGVLDLARPGEAEDITAFRLSGWAKALLSDKIPQGFSQENEALMVRSDLRISARRLVPRPARYQLARFCQLEKETLDEYRYRITPASLSRAQQQGLTVAQLLALLSRYAKVIPPRLTNTLERWEKHGVEIHMEKMIVLRVASEDILQALRKSRASRFIGEPLGPTTVSIKPGAVEKVLAVLGELGYLGEVRGELD